MEALSLLLESQDVNNVENTDLSYSTSLDVTSPRDCYIAGTICTSTSKYFTTILSLQSHVCVCSPLSQVRDLYGTIQFLPRNWY